MRHHEGYLGKVLEDGQICASYGGEPGLAGTLPHVAARVCCECGWQGSEYRAPAGTLWRGGEHEVYEERAHDEWVEHVRTAPRKYPNVPSWELKELIQRIGLHELGDSNLSDIECAIREERERRKQKAAGEPHVVNAAKV
jgi:hypothetical protein